MSFFDVSVFLDQHAFEFVDDCDADFVSRIMACFNDISFVQFVTYGVFKKLVDLYISDTGVVIDLVSLVSLQVRSELETFETCV